jgi:hypothetical protein
VRLDPRLVVVRAREVAAHRHAERVRAVARRAQRAPEARVGTVGHEHVPGAHPLDRAALLALHDRAAHEAVLDQGLEGLGRGPHGGARLHCDVGDHLVEIASPHDVAVVRELGVVGPGQLERDTVADRAQAVEALTVAEPLLEAHVDELLHRTRREAVAAGLLPREPLALDHQDPVPALGEPVRGRRARRARADDEHVPNGPVRPGRRRRTHERHGRARWVVPTHRVARYPDMPRPQVA